jgi:hypothetical protein
MEVSTADLALILGVTPRRLQQLAAAKVFLAARHGEWELAASVQAFVKHQVESEAAKHAKTRGKAREKLDQVKAEREALKLDQERAALMPTAEALAILDDIVGVIRTGCAGLPARITRDLALRGKIETELDAILGRAADQLEQRSVALRSGGDDAAAAETLAGASVGREEPHLPAELGKAGAARPDADALCDPVRSGGGKRPIPPGGLVDGGADRQDRGDTRPARREARSAPGARAVRRPDEGLPRRPVRAAPDGDARRGAGPRGQGAARQKEQEDT